MPTGLKCIRTCSSMRSEASCSVAFANSATSDSGRKCVLRLIAKWMVNLLNVSRIKEA